MTTPSRTLVLSSEGEPLRLATALALASLVVAVSLVAGAPGPVLVGIPAVVVAGALAIRRLARVERELKGSKQALSNRLTELATLHSISQEIVSSTDLDRVFSTLERECRRIFDVDFFFVAAVDPRSHEIRILYRRERGEATRETARPMGSSLASWVVAEKRSVRVDDFRDRPPRLPFRPRIVDDKIRSALAVPLCVEDRVTGVLSVQSRRPGAYDDHHLSVLYTIGQQAAVVMENARHYEMATVDSLTGLSLRESFFRRLEEEHTRALRYGGQFALMMIDLDGFKEINDRHGHPVGDRYLAALGQAVRARLRSADLACRYGGDELCLLLPHTGPDGARVMAESVRSAVAALALDSEEATVRTTASIGLAAFPNHDSGDWRVLLRKADQALYEAKRAGRNRVVSFAP